MANAGLVVFVVAGPALTVVNKSILDAGFEHPVLVSSFGMAATMVFTRAANARGPRGSHRTPSHPIEGPLDPLQDSAIGNAPALVPGPLARL